MANVFLSGPAQTNNGGVSAENVILTVGGQDVMVAQQFQFTLTRNLNMLYEIGTTKTYYVGNRRQGQGQLNRVVAGASGFTGAMTKLGDMCTPVDCQLGGFGCKGGAVTYTLKQATATSLGASVTAQDVIITESIGIIFVDIDYG
jgi:hypothetical protein